MTENTSPIPCPSTTRMNAKRSIDALCPPPLNAPSLNPHRNNTQHSIKRRHEPKRRPRRRTIEQRTPSLGKQQNAKAAEETVRAGYGALDVVVRGRQW